LRLSKQTTDDDATKMMQLKSNFFKQPAQGFDDHSQGRTERQLDEYEAKVGFKLPASYRELMRQQNGGSVRYEKITGEDNFDFNGGFSQLRLDLAYYITNFKNYILATCDEDELAATQKQLTPFYPERLVLFAGLDGHSAAFFDYGYRQAEPVKNPSIVFIGDDGDDFLHFGVIGPQLASFDAFLENLSLDADVEDAVYLGVESTDDYATTMQQLAKYLLLDLKIHLDDDRYGHFNFDVWHSAHVPVELDDADLQAYAEQNGTSLKEMQEWASTEGRTRNVYTIFSPNQHRAGTYLFHDNPNITLVLEIKKSWFAMQKPVEGLVKILRQLPAIVDVVMLP
jgi:SMI1-KNR4 cell-wall